MKKSTLLYLLLNVLIMLIPLVCISALSYKIKTGDVVDVKALEASYYKNINLPSGFSELEVTSSHPLHPISVVVNVMDSVNTLRTDTSSYKYISYSLSDGKLKIHYDFLKDSLDKLRSNPHVIARDYDNYESDYAEAPESRATREVIVYVKTNLTKVNTVFSEVTVDLDDVDNGRLINDLDVTCDYSAFSLNAPYRSEEAEDGSSKTILIPFPHRLNMKLMNASSANLHNFSYLKRLDLELTNGSKIDGSFSKEEFNLTIDKKSSYYIDVNELDKVKINYKQ